MRRSRLFALVACTFAIGAAPESGNGTRPTDAAGRPLNLDFETGDLRDWTATGTAFTGQPVAGDVVAARRADMKSGHQGKFWVGTYEKAGDAPTGTLTSRPFLLSKRYLRFLIAGGPRETTRVEVVRADKNTVIYQASGDETEELKAVAADLNAHQGKAVFLRLVDQDSGGWGHINFDDATLWDTLPPGPLRAARSAPDVFMHDGLAPTAAAGAMTVPPGFKVTLFAGEPDVVQPIAFAIDDRGRLWVCEAYSYPRRVPEKEARDRILIFEDTDGDGHFDKRKVFADKLNLVSGIELGFGGVWVGAAPQFLFIPDKNGDDVPDGPPQVLLDGWGHQDTHETLNSFIWGPDGWLYGCHGIFTHSLIGKPGTAAKDRVPLNAGIWRYHPTRHVFEVFAHGTSNPWGVDFDAHGQAFLTSCVIPHLYHVIQGGRYERQAGTHFNPYTYDDIKTIADHRHYVGANPHGGNGRSDSAGGGHAHAGALIYQGNLWPREYRGSIFMNNIHGARLNRDTLEPKGSGFIGHHAPDFLLANDRWSQIVSLKSGPDGNVYMIDWYDKNQCHRNETEMHDRTNGRIFKISFEDQSGAAREAKLPVPNFKSRLEEFRRGKKTDLNVLTSLFANPNDWHTRHVRRQVQEYVASAGAGVANDEAFQRFIHWGTAVANPLTRHTGVGSETPANPLLIADQIMNRLHSNRLKSDLNSNGPKNGLNALWLANAAGRLTTGEIPLFALNPDPYWRAWSIQLLCEAGTPKPKTLLEFASLAKSDPSPVVRLYLASALQRLPLAERWPILEGLVTHGEDANDHNIPLMVWYAAEPLADVDPSRALALASESKLPRLLPFMVRRVAATGTPESVALLVGLIGKSPAEATRLTIVEGLNEALKGRRQVEMPKGWDDLYPSLRGARDARLASLSKALAVTFGDPGALSELRLVLADRKADANARREALTALLKARDPKLSATLVALLDDATLRGPALKGLAAFEEPRTAEAVLKVYPRLAPEERRDALNTLAARVASARTLLAAVGSGKLASKDLSADIIRQLRNLNDRQVNDQIGKVWGTARETSAERARLIASYRRVLLRKGNAPDLELGRAVFAKTCQQCHKLFGAGSNIGPELTGSNRADREYVLSNVLDPSALIGKDYVAHVIATTDGRTLTGLIRQEDKDAVTLQTANEVVVIPRGEIEARKPSEQSMMPEDIWKPLTDAEVRALVAYLASPGQVPMRATKENAAAIFNGRDLAGWVGDPSLWSVKDGMIVGKTKGLTHNAFLRCELSAADFRLTVVVQLVNNEGNSGIQFRSAALPDGEMKGDQADIGVGWWGKLYEENGRGLLWPRSGEANVRPGEWNTYEVLAVGSRIRTRINGKDCVDLDDPAGARRGIFAFQLHSGGATEVRYKDIRLELDPKP